MKTADPNSEKGTRKTGLSRWEKVRSVFYTIAIIVLVAYLAYTFQKENENILVREAQSHLLASAKSITFFSILAPRSMMMSSKTRFPASFMNEVMNFCFLA